MCGIAGIWSPFRTMEAGTLISMLSAQSHRGPDGCGAAFWRNTSGKQLILREKSSEDLRSQPLGTFALSLGHNWLAIQDTSADAQMPLVSDDGRFTLVYNGEIYNFRHIREKLVSEGHTFKTHSDAEVLLKKWELKGPSSLADFRGMFAFLIYDSIERTLWAARDPFGIKPLYFAKIDNSFAFASEIRAFHKSGFIKRELDEEAALSFLAAGVNKPGEERTFYKDVFELSPGKFIKVTEAGMEIRAYAELPPLEPSLSLDAAVEGLRNAVEESVSLHTISERPIASCMSGGLDSTTVAAAIKRAFSNGPCPYKAFTIAAANSEADSELELAQKAALSLGLSHEIYRRPQVVSLLDVVDMVVSCETPNHVIGPINQYLLLRHISSQPEGIKVVLDGQGGDELLSGYPWYSKFLFDEIGRTEPEALPGIRESYFRRLPLSPEMHDCLTSIFTDKMSWVKGFENGIGPFLGISPEETLRLDPVKYYLSNSDSWQSFRTREYLQGELQYLLRQEDRLGMHFGIECRVPFVDIEIVKMAIKIKASVLIKDGYLKYPFRVLFPEIPSDVRWNTDKRGFWDIPEDSFPYMRNFAEKAVMSSPFIKGLVERQGGNLSAFANLGGAAVWRLFQIAVLENCATSAEGTEWITRLGFSHSGEAYI